MFLLEPSVETVCLLYHQKKDFISVPYEPKDAEYAWLQTTEDEAADCEVVALYVRYSKRNNGIGKLLLQYANSYFKGIDKKRMIIWCLKENYEARRFYEIIGGKESRISSHNWGGKEYEIISYLYDIE